MIDAAIIVQMRLDSTRLPRKALLPLGGTVMASYVMQRLKKIPAVSYILACDEASYETFAPYADAQGFRVFAGPKEDVLLRYCMAAETVQTDWILRATGDNPLVSYELARLLLEETDEKADYSAYIGMPRGMGVELVKKSALNRVNLLTREAIYREHVCPYLYEHPELFYIVRKEAPAKYHIPGASVTVDTKQDYDYVKGIIDACNNEPDDDTILQLLVKDV
mgnify:CR=1 FL=1